MAASRRKLRFIVDAKFVRNPWYGWLLRLCRVIPIERRPGPKSLKTTFAAAEAALRNGEVVCMFPEGYPTRNGVMLPFRRGLEKLAKGAAVPIVPVWLDQLWGSVLSYKRGRLFWKRSERGRFPVTATFGKALSNLVTAPQVRQVLQEMSAEIA